MKTKKLIQRCLRNLLTEQDTNLEDFEDALLNLATLDLEDDQVNIPLVFDNGTVGLKK